MYVLSGSSHETTSCGRISFENGVSLGAKTLKSGVAGMSPNISSNDPGVFKLPRR